MPTTFMVAGPDGPKSIEAKQLATFAYYIEQVQFRFVVTELPGRLPDVTHRHSGLRVCGIELTTLSACRNDPLEAGKLALKRIIEAKGEARVASALRAAEAAALRPQQ